MPKKLYEVQLSEADINRLKKIRNSGENSARMIMHANILLNTHDSSEKKKTDRELAEFLGISPTTVNQVRKTFSEFGLETALNRKTRVTPAIASKVTGDLEAKIIATALTNPPDGYARWTLRLLAEHCMEKKYIVSISYVAIGDILNTNQLKPHLSEYWCIPKENDANFVANMEDVLHIYQKPYDPMCPVICMDEKPIQLLGEIRSRIAAKPLRITPETGLPKPGRTQKIDSEYVRKGTASIFMFTEPLAGWRHVVALEHRTKGDFAKMMKEVSDIYYPDTDKIILVADNLNTHNKASFYEAFPAETAFDLSQKFEFHYTPKHGSWLNIAETELSSLSAQCLGNRRISSLDELNVALSSWESERNRKQRGVDWQFTTEDARVKLKRLYPTPLFDE